MPGDVPAFRGPLGLRLLLAAAAALVLPLSPALAGRADATPAEDFVPAYMVPGRPGEVSDQSLPEVAAITLGDGSRWLEIFALNRGRVQPDGGVLVSPATRLRSGWVLVLPSDARPTGYWWSGDAEGPGAGRWSGW